jgi:UDP-N-acetylglucosamine pyrophosphorylase
MPITDTSFIEAMKAKQGEKLSALMQNMTELENIERRLAVVILAAGLGKRMKSPDKPKVMFELGGKPMIRYVIEIAFKLKPDIIIPVVGHHKEQVIDYVQEMLLTLPLPAEGGSTDTPNGSEDISNTVIDFAVQEPQLGTGHAVMQTEELLSKFTGEVLILSGDVPMLKYNTVMKLVNEHFFHHNYATMLTVLSNNPSGYGRIVRDNENKFLKIVEDKDADEKIKKINEINPAIYIVNSNVLFDTLKKITPGNNQKEYYLTDIFSFIPKEKIGTVTAVNQYEVAGINSAEQLEAMERKLKE